MDADFERDFRKPVTQSSNPPMEYVRLINLKPNTFQLLEFIDKNHYPCEFEKVW